MKKMFANLLWVLLALAGAWAYATLALRRGEHLNSAYILIALPIGVFGFLMLLRRAYLRPLWTTTPGLVMIAGALVLMVLGGFWMRKVVTVEV